MPVNAGHRRDARRRTLSLSGQVALVTGATRGLGLAIARGLAANIVARHGRLDCLVNNAAIRDRSPLRHDGVSSE